MRAGAGMAVEEVVAADWEPLPAPQEERSSSGHFLLKIVASALLFGFCCEFLYSSFSSWRPDKRKEKGWDLFSGEWILNPAGPYYTNETCNVIDPYQNCMKNGRPDTGYLYWRWKPENYDLPPFDPEKFLNAMRDKSWALIGDSIFRNQIQSLICLLTKIEEPVEVFHENNYKTRTWYYSSYNFTLAVIWAPFLVHYETINNGPVPSTSIQLHLDVLDTKWTTEYHKYDYIVISGGQWFYKSTVMWENTKVIGCHNCDDKSIEELGVGEPYRKSLELTFKFIITSPHKPFVIFRTWTPDHFEYGKWYNGGICNRTEPYKKGEFSGDSTDLIMRSIEIDEFQKAKAIGEKSGVRMELLDTYYLSLMRPDGHPGPYRTFHPFDEDKTKKVQNDCLHWCLPGPIDTWNEILLKMLVNDDNPGYASS